MRTLIQTAIAYFVLSGTIGFAQVPEFFNEDTTTTHQLSLACQAQHMQPRRIVIVVPKNRQDRLKEQDIFAAALAKQLTASGISAVVSKQRICDQTLPVQRGVFDERHLIRMAKDYRADAVLYSDVRSVGAYRPMNFASTVLLVDTNQAIALASLDSTLDLSRPSLQQVYQRFAYDSGKMVGETHLDSPTLFIRYAARGVAKNLSAIWGR